MDDLDRLKTSRDLILRKLDMLTITHAKAIGKENELYTSNLLGIWDDGRECINLPFQMNFLPKAFSDETCEYIISCIRLIATGSRLTADQVNRLNYFYKAAKGVIKSVANAPQPTPTPLTPPKGLSSANSFPSGLVFINNVVSTVSGSIPAQSDEDLEKIINKFFDKNGWENPPYKIYDYRVQDKIATKNVAVEKPMMPPNKVTKTITTHLNKIAKRIVEYLFYERKNDKA